MVKMMESSGSSVGEDRVRLSRKRSTRWKHSSRVSPRSLLDLKSIAMKMSKQTEERSRQELKRVQPIVQGSQVPGAAGATPQQGGVTVVIRKGARPADAESQAPAEPAMDMIMQTDGTMKPEPGAGKRTTSSLQPAMAETRKEPRSSQNRAISFTLWKKTSPMQQRSKDNEEPDLCTSQSWR